MRTLLPVATLLLSIGLVTAATAGPSPEGAQPPAAAATGATPADPSAAGAACDCGGGSSARKCCAAAAANTPAPEAEKAPGCGCRHKSKPSGS